MSAQDAEKATKKSAATLARNAAASEAVLDVMARLRDPHDGCPWDIEQTFRTIAPYTIEEAYEVADAIERQDMPALKEELGDLLFALASRALNLVGQLLELFERRPLVEGSNEWLRSSRLGHRWSS